MVDVNQNETLALFVGLIFTVLGVFLFYTIHKQNIARKSVARKKYRPSGIVIEKLKKKYPGITDGEIELVWQALYSFFEIIRRARNSGEKVEAYMPSVIVDDLWHEMILDTKNYMNFCKKFYGNYIHHHPGTVKFETDFTDKEVNLDTVKTYGILKEMKVELFNGLPLLLSVDEVLGVKNGFRYNIGLLNKQLVDYKDSVAS